MYHGSAEQYGHSAVLKEIKYVQIDLSRLEPASYLITSQTQSLSPALLIYSPFQDAVKFKSVLPRQERARARFVLKFVSQSS